MPCATAPDVNIIIIDRNLIITMIIIVWFCTYVGIVLERRRTVFRLRTDADGFHGKRLNVAPKETSSTSKARYVSYAPSQCQAVHRVCTTMLQNFTISKHTVLQTENLTDLVYEKIHRYI